MKRLFLIMATLGSLLSCTSHNISRTLKNVESYIMERPDSALTVLESIERSHLKTPRNRAHHALLHAMALDKNYIDVTDDSIAQVAVDYYSRKGADKNKARAYYYLGLAYYYQEEYDKAILEYSKAERIAEKCDSLYLGMAYATMSHIYNRTYNSHIELIYAQKAYDVFTDIDAEQYIRISKYRMAVSFHNNDDYDYAVKVYKEIISESTSADYIMTQSIIDMAHSMIEMVLGADQMKADEKLLLHWSYAELMKDVSREHIGSFSDQELRLLLDQLCKAGLIGMEVYYSTHTPEQTEYLKQLIDRDMEKTGE